MSTRSAASASSSALDVSIRHLRGVGEESAPLLERMGIRTMSDLLWHLPSRYMDFSRFRPLRSLVPDQEQSAIAMLGEMSTRRSARGTQMTEAELLEEDGTPSPVRAVWFGRVFVKEKHRPGERVRISGKVKWLGRVLQFSAPKIEPADAPAVHTGRLVPVYPLTEGLKEGNVRRWLHTVTQGDARSSPLVDEVPELLPPDIRERHALPRIADALRQVHFPDDETRLLHARRRLAFDELLILQLALAQRRARWTAQARGLPLAVNDRDLAGWIAALPFVLTAAQVRTLDGIRTDLARTVPMSRLLEGDVGSGKTVVAALAARIAVSAGAQVALMAPTELLAEQHARTLASLFGDRGPRMALLTSSTASEPRRRILAGLAECEIDVVVGTHALVEERVAFARLGLAVVDEQHRFGVRQRATFRDKGDAHDPHLLLTTATPIPQTLSQTIYRDLDISAVDELPQGRQLIRTELRGPDALPKVWSWLRDRAAAGEQAFVVCPRIDPDADPSAPPSAVGLEHELRSGPLAGLRLGLVHGRLPPAEREAVMRRFAAGNIDVLVATTVIEVGIDVPNATAMVILGAEHFGLAQLHQLRGRVGRGEKRSFCVLVSEARDSARLGAMTERRRLADGTYAPLDGFELAKRDLEIRGAGEFLGLRQSGAPELRIVDLADVDPRLVADTATEADALLAADPVLDQPEHRSLALAVERLWRRYALA